MRNQFYELILPKCEPINPISWKLNLAATKPSHKFKKSSAENSFGEYLLNQRTYFLKSVF